MDLETCRLFLRPLAEADLEGLIELDSDPEVMRYLTGGRPTDPAVMRSEVLPRRLSFAQRFPGFGFWAAFERSTGQFLGWFHLYPNDGGKPDEAELGYRLRRSAWGQGYATEGARALIRHGFAELGLNRIYAQTMTINHGSRRVMEKAGLQYVRTFYPSWPDPIEGAEQGEVEYALTRDEWERLTP